LRLWRAGSWGDEFQSVQQNSSYKRNGRSPFNVYAQWRNPATGEIHVFRSENLWFDPSPYLKGNAIRVLMERGNPRRYHLDLSFLPKMAN
jgi:hypothetical protein